MTSTETSSPRVAYLDTCVPSAIVKGELSSNDSQAMARLGALVNSSAVSFWTSTVMLEEMGGIPESYRGPYLEAYEALRIVTGHPTTQWLDEESSEQTEHPTFAALEDLLPDRNDARHLFQAKINGIDEFVTVDHRTILSRASEIWNVVGIRVQSPSQYVAQFDSAST